MDLLLNNPWVILIGGGFVIGFLIGVTGVGAGSLTTPLLISGVGIPPTVAVGTDLLFAAITKASAAWRHHRLGNVEWGILRWLAAGSLPGAAVVLGWLYWAEPDTAVLSGYIRQVLAIALVISAIAIILHVLFKDRTPHTADPVDVRRLPTLGYGFILGALVALTSVGAGAIGVAVLAGLYPLLLARRVVGTDIVHAVPLTLLAGVGHAGLGNIDLYVLIGLLVGSVPGIALGSRITGHIPDWILRVLLAFVLSYAAYLLYQHGFVH
ncbi:MAG: sulfite exporter TauE/SafE family protein [Alphaproteobacteria bacterium]|nr:sulfite exporter TauE/SafE family protein [Alphaproteobacteria bacterium]